MLRISAGGNTSHLGFHWHAYIASQASVWPLNRPREIARERDSTWLRHERVKKGGQAVELHALFRTIQTIHTHTHSIIQYKCMAVGHCWPPFHQPLAISFNTAILWNAWNCLLFKPLSGVRVNTVNETDLWMPCIVLFIHSFRSVNSNSYVCLFVFVHAHPIAWIAAAAVAMVTINSTVRLFKGS